MDFVLALILAATVMFTAALSSSRTDRPAQHRGGASVADIRARLAAENECGYEPAGRW
ncbi:hypothetical protein ABZ412_08215 [Nocardia sp. NPDC005746]|uniref:hypothetical protein n=1 Tax=Nocardia sp. NPDC005746 TaxID=3157062 RepID=UPI0033FB7EFC